MTVLPPGREIVGPEKAPMEMALYGDAFVHISALPDVEHELKGMSPVGALVREQLYRALQPTVPACLAGPNAPDRP